MAKRKTLPKDFEQLVETGNEQEIKNVFEKCDINAYGGYNKGNAFEFLISESMMRWLMEQGADINYVDTYGYTPLLYHAGHKYAEEQAISLVKLGADIFATQGWNRETVLHKAVSAGSLNLVKCLLEAGADATVTDANGDIPLEHAFRCAMTFDLIKLELVTAYLLEEGIPVTERLQNYMQKVAEDIEFRRKDLNPEYIDELDHAMNHLYELLHVKPVPKRVLYDGKTRIEIHAKSWQKQHAELWNLLVPGSGHAGTVQGEVVRWNDYT
ncbi:MAG: ankyrin repeat domain-containing protein [Coprococcus sp.]